MSLVNIYNFILLYLPQDGYTAMFSHNSTQDVLEKGYKHG